MSNVKQIKEYITFWPHDHTEGPVLFVKKLKTIDLTDEQIYKLLFLIDGTCHHCWNEEDDCSCWNDM